MEPDSKLTENMEKTVSPLLKAVATTFDVLLAGGFLLGTTLLGVAVYVVWHFIFGVVVYVIWHFASKFW